VCPALAHPHKNLKRSRQQERMLALYLVLGVLNLGFFVTNMYTFVNGGSNLNLALGLFNSFAAYLMFSGIRKLV
jgi:hypothetical protein